MSYTPHAPAPVTAQTQAVEVLDSVELRPKSDSAPAVALKKSA